MPRAWSRASCGPASTRRIPRWPRRRDWPSSAACRSCSTPSSPRTRVTWSWRAIRSSRSASRPCRFSPTWSTTATRAGADTVHILGEVGLASGPPALADGLRDRDSGVRLLAARSIAKIPGERADELLESALRDRDEDVRIVAIKLWQNAGGRRDQGLPHGVVVARWGPRRAGGAPPLAGPTEVDVAVVGAGYTGLWTAYYLRRPSRRCAWPPREGDRRLWRLRAEAAGG